MTAFEAFLPRAACNFRRDRSMTLRTRTRSERSVNARRTCFGKRCNKGSIPRPVRKRF